MSLDTNVRRSRRALLSAALGTAAGSALAALGRPLPAKAADGDALILGQVNTASTVTRLDAGGLRVGSFTGSVGAGEVEAISGDKSAVYGWCDGPLGTSGVHGHANSHYSYGVTASHLYNYETALYVEGKARLATRSGRAIVAAGTLHVDVDMRTKGYIDGTPLCFANLMSYRAGVSVATVRPNYPIRGKMRIYLTRTVSSPAYVAWFVLN
jgi:hypothetical protein